MASPLGLISNDEGMENKEIRRHNFMLLKGKDTLEELARKLDGNPSHLSQINTGHRDIGDALARKIEKKYRKPRGWMDVAHNSLREGTRLAAGPDIQTRVPLISWVHAGRVGETEDLSRVAEDWMPMPKKAGPNTYCLKVQGDSMAAAHGKSYPEGSVIFVDPDLKSPSSGQRVVAKLNGSDEVVFKCFVQEAGRIFLKPMNPQYPPIFEPFKVLGTVVGKWEDD